MIRYACWLALFGVCAVPDWASAFNRRCWSGPVYYQPAYYQPEYCPPVYYPPPCVPVYVAVPECVPHSNAVPKASRPAAAPRPMPTDGDVVRPAGGTTLPKSPPVPEKLDIPKFEPAAPPKIDVPKFEPIAPPTAAPSDAVPPLIPPPNLPPLPTTEKKTEALPPLVLPPETGGRSTSKSSPVSSGVTATAYPASGKASADGRMAVGFYNHTDREVALTIEGKDVKLPAKSYLTAKLGATFRWKHGDNPTETATVPADAIGLDVVFRE